MLIVIAIIVLFLQPSVQLKNISSTTSKYDVLEIHNLLTKEECNQLIQLAKESNMVDSSVVEADTLYKSKPEFRKSF